MIEAAAIKIVGGHNGFGLAGGHATEALYHAGLVFEADIAGNWCRTLVEGCVAKAIFVGDRCTFLGIVFDFGLNFGSNHAVIVVFEGDFLPKILSMLAKILLFLQLAAQLCPQLEV